MRHPPLSHIRPDPPPSLLHPLLSHAHAGLARACGTPAAAKTPRATKSPRRAAKSPWSASQKRSGPLSTPRRFPAGSRWPDDLTSIIMKFSGGGEHRLANVAALQPCLHCCSSTGALSCAGLPSLASACQSTRRLAGNSDVWRGAYDSEFPKEVEVSLGLVTHAFQPCLRVALPHGRISGRFRRRCGGHAS